MTPPATLIPQPRMNPATACPADTPLPPTFTEKLPDICAACENVMR
ncbi:hypothetical protein ABIA39_000382 [Nocardia sp. GAS34]